MPSILEKKEGQISQVQYSTKKNTKIRNTKICIYLLFFQNFYQAIPFHLITGEERKDLQKLRRCYGHLLRPWSLKVDFSHKTSKNENFSGKDIRPIELLEL